MTLFNDTEIFASGSDGKKVFNLPDKELMLYDNFFTKDESDRYYTTLLNTTPWQEYAMEMYDKTVTVIDPRVDCETRTAGVAIGKFVQCFLG